MNSQTHTQMETNGSFSMRGDVLVRLPKHKKLGVFFFFVTVMILPVVISLWAITQFVVNSTVATTVDFVTTTGTAIAFGGLSSIQQTAQMLNVVFGFLGITSPLWLILAIVFSVKRTPVQGYEYDSRSGKGKDSVIPDEIKGWNWGAAFLSPLWGAYNNVWMWLIAFVPFVGWIWWIFMGIFGNEWAWRKDYWPSVEAFKASQKKWKPWAIVVLIIAVLSTLASIILPFMMAFSLSRSIPRSNQPYEMPYGDDRVPGKIEIMGDGDLKIE